MSINLSSIVNPNQLTSGTVVSLSGTTAGGFTGIPSSVKQIQVVLGNISLSGTDDVYIQLGSGSYTTTGYTSYQISSAVGNATAGYSSSVGFSFTSNSAANVWSGVVNLINITGNTWVCSAVVTGLQTATIFSWFVAGSVPLAGVLDRVRITSSGANTFDNGSINIIYQ